MKYTLFSICLLLAISTQAQSFRFGASFAPSTTWWLVEGDNYTSTEKKLGLQFGGELDLVIGETGRFALSSGLRFTTAPGSFEQNPESQGYQGKAWDCKVSTLDLPIMLRLRSNEMGKSVLFAQYGVTMGFTLTSDIGIAGGKGGGDDFEYEGSNTSLTMGAGMEYLLSDDMTLMFTAFFQNGVKNMVLNTQNSDNDSRYFPQQVGVRATVLF